MKDFLVVGCGLSGIAICEFLEQKGRSFLVMSDHSQQSSRIAGGLYNPVILKRFTLAWRAEELMRTSLPFYGKLEKKLKVRLDTKFRILRRLASAEEQNNWFEAADKPGLENYMAPELIDYNNSSIASPFHYGEVLFTGRIDTGLLLDRYSEYLSIHHRLISETFDYSLLGIKTDGFDYGGETFRHLIFCEGYGMVKNPFFKYLPLNGTIGELLTIKAPELQEEHIIKAGVFIMPAGNDFYRVGATYKWKDKTNIPTVEAREELVLKLNKLIACPNEVVEQVAGIRPTVADRRPLVGAHPTLKNMWVLNGLGSRGVLIAPFAAGVLVEHIESNYNIPEEMDVRRYQQRFSESVGKSSL